MVSDRRAPTTNPTTIPSALPTVVPTVVPTTPPPTSSATWRYYGAYYPWNGSTNYGVERSSTSAESCSLVFLGNINSASTFHCSTSAVSMSNTGYLSQYSGSCSLFADNWTNCPGAPYTSGCWSGYIKDHCPATVVNYCWRYY